MTTDHFIAENPEIFEFTGSDSLLQFSTVLKLYWLIWAPAMCIIFATYFVVVPYLLAQKIEMREDEEFNRWISIFGKLERIYKAIGRVSKSRNISRKPSTGIHSFKFNLLVL